jgi:Fic family protein
MQAGLSTVQDQDSYHDWDKLRHLEPPTGLSSEDWWYVLRLRRSSGLRELPIRDPKSRPVFIGAPDALNKLLSRLDSGLRGNIGTLEPILNTDTRKRFIASSLAEEAISSSMLEGAATTRRVAQDMIRSGRKPQGRGERMVLNNLAAMEHLRELADEPMTPGRVLELHRIVTEGTLDDPSAAGRLRRADEEIQVIDSGDNTVVHTPPPAHELESRLLAMCDFAEGKTPNYYLHPAVRSILLHYWLALDHPFVDGNGRTARALFYWSMKRHGFWLTEHISISHILRTSAAKYSRSFQLVSTDENDATHFVYDQVQVILRALKALEDYVERKSRAVGRTLRALRASHSLNHRQLALLIHALRHPDALYTIRSHQTSHRVVYQTARTDMLGLADQNLLDVRKIGRKLTFTPKTNLEARLGEL